MPRPVEWICEIEPPTRPDLMHVRHQIGVLSKVASAYLIPDNHVGRATVSSIAVAHEVDRMGGRSIACLNARDRNALGFRRDLLTGAAYGVDEFLFVYGDDPASGARTGQLTVRSMIEALRQFSEEHQGDAGRFRAGVTTRLRPLARGSGRPTSCSSRCRSTSTTCSPGGTPSTSPATSTPASWSSPAPPWPASSSPTSRRSTCRQSWLDAIERDRTAGVELACELAQAVAESGAFDGVHLIPGVRYRETAACWSTRRSLSSWLIRRRHGRRGRRAAPCSAEAKLHTEQETSQDDKEITLALQRLVGTVDDNFHGLGAAVRDPAVKDDARSVAQAFAGAVDATIDEAKSRLKKNE